MNDPKDHTKPETQTPSSAQVKDEQQQFVDEGAYADDDKEDQQ